MLWLFSSQLQYNVSFYISRGPTPRRVVGQHTDALFGVRHSREIKCSVPRIGCTSETAKSPGPPGSRCHAITGLKAARAAASRSFLFNSACFDSLQLVEQLDLVQACVEESSFHAWNCNYVLFFQAASSKRCLPVCII